MLTVPGLCWLCRMPLALSRWGICSVCERAARRHVSLCPRCGLPSAHPTMACGRCLQKAPPWQRLITVSDYAPPLSTLIHQLKFSRRSDIAPALSRVLLLEVLQARRQTGLTLPDRLISVPLWQRRHWRRGLIRAICYASRCLAGCAVPGTVEALRAFALPPLSTISVPDCASAT